MKAGKIPYFMKSGANWRGKTYSIEGAESRNVSCVVGYHVIHSSQQGRRRFPPDFMSARILFIYREIDK